MRPGILFFVLISAFANAAKLQVFEREAALNAAKLDKPLAHFGAVRLLAGFHDGPGDIEVHTNENDITHILEGEAEFVTGGKVVGNHQTAPGEWRGGKIEGGETRVIKAGEILYVPAGTPHWFKSVKSPVRYSVVKFK